MEKKGNKWHLEKAKELLGDRIKDIFMTGSRVICPKTFWHSRTDYDFVVLVEDLAVISSTYADRGLQQTDQYANEDDVSEKPSFITLKNGLLNLIITDNEEFFSKYSLATTIAMHLGLNRKKDRIFLFQAILYRRIQIEE